MVEITALDNGCLFPYFPREKEICSKQEKDM